MYTINKSNLLLQFLGYFYGHNLCPVTLNLLRTKDIVYNKLLNKAHSIVLMHIQNISLDRHVIVDGFVRRRKLSSFILASRFGNDLHILLKLFMCRTCGKSVYTEYVNDLGTVFPNICLANILFNIFCI